MRILLSGLAALLVCACNPRENTHIEPDPAEQTKVTEVGDSAALKARNIKRDLETPCALAAAASTEEWTHDAERTLSVVSNACALPVDDVTIESAIAELGETGVAWTARGDVLTMFMRSEGDTPHSCCSIQERDFTPLNQDKTIWVARYRLKELQAGLLSQFDGPVGDSELIEWRGPNAPLKPIIKHDLTGQVTHHEVYSPQLEETRRITVYAPAAAPAAMVVMADGGSVEYYAHIVEPLIDSGAIQPVVLVGILAGQHGIIEDRSALGDIRNLDYLPGPYDSIGMEGESRFDPHLAFVADTLVPWAETEFETPPLRGARAITGKSSGGGFSLHAGVRRPDVFAHAWPMSAGFGRLETPPEERTAQRAAFRMSAGHYEPGFIWSTSLSAEILQQAGYSVDTKWYPAGHMSDQWDLRFVDNLKAVFPVKK